LETRAILLKDWKPLLKKNNKNGWKENWKDVNQEIGTDGYRTKIASVFE
jgi:hypothetical protein